MRHPLHAIQDLLEASAHMPEQVLDALARFFDEHPALAELILQAVKSWLERRGRTLEG